MAILIPFLVVELYISLVVLLPNPHLLEFRSGATNSYAQFSYLCKLISYFGKINLLKYVGPPHPSPRSSTTHSNEYFLPLNQLDMQNRAKANKKSPKVQKGTPSCKI